MLKFVEKYRISVARGCFIKDYLWWKIEVGTLYLSVKSRPTTPWIIACKNQYIVNLPESTLHATLPLVSTLRCKKSVVSSGIGGYTRLLHTTTNFPSSVHKYHPLYPMIQPIFYNEERIQATTSRGGMDSGKLTMIDFYRQWYEEMWAQIFFDK